MYPSPRSAPVLRLQYSQSISEITFLSSGTLPLACYQKVASFLLFESVELVKVS